MEAGKRRAVLEAMLVELGKSGYGDLSIEEACRSTGVSEAEFEAEFADKDECLFAAYDQLSEELVARARSECEQGQSWPEGVRRGLAAVLEAIAAQPELAQAATRAFPAIRPAAYQRYVDLVGRFVPYVKEGRTYSGVEEELPGEVELLAVGAAESIIFGEVDAGRADRLPQMMPEILFSVLVPFIGPERAADEMRSATTKA